MVPLNVLYGKSATGGRTAQGRGNGLGVGTAMKKLIGLALAGAILLFGGGAARATIIFEPMTPLGAYGTYNQRAFPSACTNNPMKACGPVSVLNSFIFLQNTYPQIYGNRLVPMGRNQPAATLNTLSALMGCCNGTTPENLLAGKRAYIDGAGAVRGVAPGTTRYDSQFLATGIPFIGATPQPTQRGTIPTMNFLLGQLHDGEDVEALISFYSKRTVGNMTFYNYVGAHYLTVTGASYDDINNNLRFDAGDMPNCISFVDPYGRDARAQSGAIVSCASLAAMALPGGQQSVLNGDLLSITNYYGSVGTSPANINDQNTLTVITGLIAESPILPAPEPASLALFAGALAALGLVQRARKTAREQRGGS
jgi:hypothetical protein